VALHVIDYKPMKPRCRRNSCCGCGPRVCRAARFLVGLILSASTRFVRIERPSGQLAVAPKFRFFGRLPPSDECGCAGECRAPERRLCDSQAERFVLGPAARATRSLYSISWSIGHCMSTPVVFSLVHSALPVTETREYLCRICLAAAVNAHKPAGSVDACSRIGVPKEIEGRSDGRRLGVRCSGSGCSEKYHACG